MAVILSGDQIDYSEIPIGDDQVVHVLVARSWVPPGRWDELGLIVYPSAWLAGKVMRWRGYQVVEYELRRGWGVLPHIRFRRRCLEREDARQLAAERIRLLGES
jgi:hypothetical protein